jgi:uracil-DNA glycosylase
MDFPSSWIQFAGLGNAVADIETKIANDGEVYPPVLVRYTALHLLRPEQVRVVVLGQDPYHNQGEAHGLSFSVPPGVRIPPSLRNIYKELNADLGLPIPDHGHLLKWAESGVLLLNAILTVKKGLAGSHRKIGWEAVTDKIIQSLSNRQEGIVFILWGNFAKEKAPLIGADRHLIIQSSHPSPIGGSCYKGFFGSKPFSRANEYLATRGKPAINWAI